MSMTCPSSRRLRRLHKAGGGNVTLTAANTYTDRPSCAKAPCPGRADSLSATAVTVGGTNARAPDLYHDIHVAALTLADGAIVNGTVSAASIIKTGTGTATLAATCRHRTAARPSTAHAGLWEGLTSRTSNDPYRYTPKQNIRLTTYAGNGGNSANTSNSGGMWAGNNHTYAYAGCIWNRTATNQVWNFRGAFDDYVYLVIDRSLVLYRNGNSGPSTGTFTATPGPHYFDARFGDGSGNVGCNLTGMMDSGLNWDPGDGAGWRVVSDPGDGSILTTSSVNRTPPKPPATPAANPALRVARSAVAATPESTPATAVFNSPRAANGFINVPDGNVQSATLPNGYVGGTTSAVYPARLEPFKRNQNWTYQNLDDSCLIVITDRWSFQAASTNGHHAPWPLTHAFEAPPAYAAGRKRHSRQRLASTCKGRHTTEAPTSAYAYGNGMRTSTPRRALLHYDAQRLRRDALRRRSRRDPRPALRFTPDSCSARWRRELVDTPATVDLHLRG